MLWTSLFVALVLPLASLAAPLRRRDVDIDDNQILKFANVIGQLKIEFYKQVLAKFHDQDFTNAGFSSADVPKQIIQDIIADEQSHTSLLTSGIEGGAIQGCRFKFDPILTDVKTTMAAARVFEQVSVGAYLGAGLLVQERNFLLVTSSILTNEARHQSSINVLNGGTNTPQAFDFALRPEQVLSVISPFISGCNLDITPVKPLKLTSELHSRAAVTFDSTGLPTDRPLFCQMLIGGQPSGLSQPIESCSFPVDPVDGPIAIYITDDATPLAANILSQNYESIQAGPVIAFIDGKNAVLSKLVVKHKSLQPANKSAQAAIKVIGVSSKPKVKRSLDEEE